MHKSDNSIGEKKSGHVVTASHELFDGTIKIFRTVSSGKFWQMSCWVKEQQRYFRKSLRTKDLDEAKQLATDEYIEIKARLRNGEIIFSKTAKALVDEYLAEQQKRVRPAGRHQGGITQGRFALITSVLNRHYLGLVGEGTRIDKIDPLTFRDYFKRRWKAQPGVRSVTLKNERSVITGLYKYARENRHLTQAHEPVFEKLAVNTQKYVGRADSRDAFSREEWESVYAVVTKWAEGVEDEAERDARYFARGSSGSSPRSEPPRRSAPLSSSRMIPDRPPPRADSASHSG